MRGSKHVMRLAPDVIKLDRSIVDRRRSDPVKARDDRRRSSVTRATSTRRSAPRASRRWRTSTRLAALDVQLGQGYGLARPAPPWAPVDRGRRNVASTR